MLLRAGILNVGLILLTLLSGCLNGSSEVQDPTDAIVQVPAPANESDANLTTFYLLFPEECPEILIGNTTYEKPKDGYNKTDCGHEITEQFLDNKHCASFEVHDKSFQIQLNDTLYATVSIMGTQGFNSERYWVGSYINFTWRDDKGIFSSAVVYRGIPGYPDGFNSYSGGTVAERDSQGAIWMDVSADAGHCWSVETSGWGVSRFDVIRAAACMEENISTKCQRPGE